jgi:hypothetical protein
VGAPRGHQFLGLISLVIGEMQASPSYLSTVPSKISVFPAFPAAIIQSLLPMSIIKACLVIVRVLK